MSIGWNFYFTSREERSASIALNFNLRESAPDPVRQNLLQIKLHMREPRPDGLSSHEESEALFAIEDALTPRLRQVCDAYFVARITGNNHREWLFYAATSGLAMEAVESAMRQYTAYTFTVTCTEDSDWSVFLEEIYPSEEDEQWVLNRMVLDRMQAKGDKLDTPRDARHFVYFSDPGNRATFRQSALSLGYAVEEELESPDNQHPFSICVSKTHDMAWDKLHDDFIKLFRACAATGGSTMAGNAKPLRARSNRTLPRHQNPGMLGNLLIRVRFQPAIPPLAPLILRSRLDQSSRQALHRLAALVGANVYTLRIGTAPARS